jgi:hypothetical protein
MTWAALLIGLGLWVLAGVAGTSGNVLRIASGVTFIAGA